MAESEKNKDKFIVRSVRGPQEAFDLLKQMSDDGFENQGEALEYLVNLYNIEEGRKQTGRATEIDEFRRHFNRIMDMYLASLALCSDAEARIREGFSVRMENQEQEIKRLRELCDERKASLDAAQKTLMDKQKEMDALGVVLRDAEDARDAAVSDHDERENTIHRQMTMLQESQAHEKALVADKERQTAEIANLKEQVASLTAKQETLEDYKQRLTKASEDLMAANKRISTMSDELATVKSKLLAAEDDKRSAVEATRVQADKEANADLRGLIERNGRLQDRCDKLQQRIHELEKA